MSAEAAAYYAAGYLVKLPQHGFPEWVLNYRGNIKRYSHSRGFFKRASQCEQPCFCPECIERLESGTEFVEEPARRETAEPKSERESKEGASPPPRHRRSVRERIASCCTKSVIVERDIWEDEQGVQFVQGVRFVQGLNLPYLDVLKLFHADFERPHEIVLVDEWDEYRLRVEAGLPGLEPWGSF